MLTTFKGIRLEEHEGEDEESYLEWFLSVPKGMLAFVARCLHSCFHSGCGARQGDGDGGAYEDNGDDEDEEDEEDEESQYALLHGRPRRFLPTHAAASFLRTGTSRRMREANGVL
ncbi:hypothetical protein E4U42_005673 [Claviceps africana]|uniref:Uncharacterized protein n=1 Tax=Claviceps africana TaxID=83212 RepID=A0A8K0J3Y5_9HYPO|nr:hypothetical protein E4U42_005673 [Claviceps africana]